MMIPHRPLRFVLATCAACLAFATSLNAQIPATWLDTTGGNWTDPDNWSTSVYPNNGSPNPADSYDVSFTPGTSFYTVTLNSDVTVNQIINQAYMASISHQSGRLDVRGDFLVDQMYADYAMYGGTLANATIRGDLGTFRLMGQYLKWDSVTLTRAIGGTTGFSLTITNGLTFDGGKLWLSGSSSYSAPGALILTSPNDLSGTGTICFTNDQYAKITSNGGDMIIPSGITINKTSQGGGYVGFDGDQTITNYGLIEMDVSQKKIYLWGNRFVNNGTINSAGGHIEVHSANMAFENNGEININNNGDFTFNGDWTNLGTINLASGTLYLGGYYALTDVGNLVQTGGTVDMRGTLENAGQTFTLPTDWLVHCMVQGGTVVLPDPDTNELSGLGLDSASLIGNAHLASGKYMNLQGDILLNGNTLRINDPAATGSAGLRFMQSGSLNGTAYIIIDGQNEATGIRSGVPGVDVSIASGITLIALGKGSLYASGLLSNHAPILIDTAGQLTLENNWENFGNIIVASGGQLTFDGTWINYATVTAQPGSTININGVGGNQGSLQASNITLNLGGQLNASDLARYNVTGSVNLSGTLNNQNNVLDLATMLATWNITGGTIIAGQLTGLPTQSLNVQQGTFEDLQLDQNVSVASNGTLNVRNNLTLLDNDILLNGNAKLYTINASHLQGNGTLTLKSGSRVESLAGKSFIDPGVTLQVNPAVTGILDGQWQNNGLIKVQTNGILALEGNLSVDDLGQIENSGTVSVRGTLQNQGHILTLGGDMGKWALSKIHPNGDDAGTLVGGTIQTPGDTYFQVDAGTLDGITIDGKLNVSGPLSIKNSLTFLPGSAMTIHDATVRLENGSSLFGEAQITAKGIATFAVISSPVSTPPGFDFHIQHTDCRITGATFSNGGSISLDETGALLRTDAPIINLGLIHLSQPDTAFYVRDTLDNQGTILIDDGTLILEENLTTAQLGNVQLNHGEISLSATLDNTGDFLTVATPGGGFTRVSRIIGGTLRTEANATWHGPTGALENVTLAQDMAILITDGLSSTGTLKLNSSQITLNSDESTATYPGVPTLTFQPGAALLGDGQIIFDGARTGRINIAGTVGTGVTIRSGTAGGEINPEYAAHWTNYGTLSAETADQFLWVDGLWHNLGLFKVSQGTLYLAGDFTTSDVGSIEHTGGEVRLVGTLDNTGATLDLDSQGGSWTIGSGSSPNGAGPSTGHIIGGTVHSDQGHVLIDQGGKLTSVNLDCDLLVNQDIHYMSVYGGLSIEAGHQILIHDTSLYFADDDALLEGAGEVVFDGQDEDGLISSLAMITLGEDLTVRTGSSGGTLGRHNSFWNPYSTISNLGTISAQTPDHPLVIVAVDFTNQGTMEVRDGGILTLDAHTQQWTNEGLILINDGTLNLNKQGTNTGTVRVVSGNLYLRQSLINQRILEIENGAIEYAFSLTPADLGTIHRGNGTVQIRSSLSNIDHDLSPDDPQGILSLADGGRLIGGRLAPGLDGRSAIEVIGSNATFTDVLVDAIVPVFDGATLYLKGTWSNTGTFDLQGTGSIAISEAFDMQDLFNRLGNVNYSPDARLKLMIACDNTAQDFIVEADRPWEIRNTLTGGRIVSTDGTPLRVTGGSLLNPVQLLADVDINTGRIDLTTDAWNNLGTIHASNATINLGGTFSRTSLGHFDPHASQVNVQGTLQNRNDTFVLDDTDNTTWTFKGVTVDGGVLTSVHGGPFHVNGQFHNQLVGVTLDAPMVVDGGSDELVVTNGLTLLNQSITLNTATSASSPAIMTFDGTQAITGSGEIVFDGLWNAGKIKTSADLTIGSQITIRSGTTGGTIGYFNQLLNQGTISARAAAVPLSLQGDLLVNEGDLEAAGENALTLSVGGIINHGRIILDNADVTTNMLLIVNEVDGAITGSGRLGMDFFRTDLTNHGLLAPGFSAGRLEINGDFSQSATATLAMEVFGPQAGDNYDQLRVNGLAQLAGQLQLVFSDEAIPVTGQSFDLLTASLVQGQFTSLVDNSAATRAWIDWTVTSTATTVTLDITSSVLRGDYNGDGIVDVIDLGILAGHWNEAGDRTQGDANGDGLVDVIDLGMLAYNWNVTLGAGANNNALPEPATLGLLMVGGSIVVTRRRRQCS